MKEEKNQVKPKLPTPLCPCCKTPMIRKSGIGFGRSEKFICPNLTCASNQKPRHWCQ